MNRKQLAAIIIPNLVNPEDHIPFDGDKRGAFKPFIAHKDGSFSLRESFFYSHGKTDRDWQNRVVDFLRKAGIEIDIVQIYTSKMTSTWFWSIQFRIIEKQVEPEIVADSELPEIDAELMAAPLLETSLSSTPKFYTRYGSEITLLGWSKKDWLGDNQWIDVQYENGEQRSYHLSDIRADNGLSQIIDYLNALETTVNSNTDEQPVSEQPTVTITVAKLQEMKARLDELHISATNDPHIPYDHVLFNHALALHYMLENAIEGAK